MQFDQMKRREFITLLGGAVTWPVAVRGQQPKIPVIGFLSSRGARDSANVLDDFHRGLTETGVVIGQNAEIIYSWAEGHYDRLPALAAELVSRQVAVIVATGGDPSVFAAKAATATIPIVFTGSNDPVKLGWVASLNRPGGNITGFSLFVGGTLDTKRFELLHELVPKATVIAMLVDQNYPLAELGVTQMHAAAQRLALQIVPLRVGAESELDAAFATLVQRGAGALYVGSSGFFNARRDIIVGLAARHAIPAIYEWRESVAAGGLASYGTRLEDAYHQIGFYAGSIILKGAKPADLPVVQPTKFYLVINLKTAKALGIAVPLTLQVAADEVID
jgi:putative tryptophan/tyrosine transport system substrate-binding protein